MEYINVPVPANRVMEVYALLASPEKRQNLFGENPKPKPDSTFSPNWRPEMLRRLYHESSGAMKVVLDVIASKADQVVHSYELVEALTGFHGKTCDHHTLAGTLGAFGRRVFNRYKADGWPMENEWDPVAQEVWYRMPSDFAKEMSSTGNA